jgi:hypothetical protein
MDSSTEDHEVGLSELCQKEKVETVPLRDPFFDIDISPERSFMRGVVSELRLPEAMARQ